MPLDAIDALPLADRPAGGRWDRLESLAWALWLILLLVLGSRHLVMPRSHTVFPIYLQAAEDWLAGREIYGPVHLRQGWDEFRYAPVVAIGFMPFLIFPEGMAEFLWRCLGLGVYLGCLAWYGRVVVPEVWQRSAWHRAGILMLLLPLSIGNVHNGQANVLLLGTMLGAIAALARKRWNLAALCLGTGILLKIYPVALALLLVIQFPRQLAGRLLLVLGLGLLVPFLIQDPGYVIQEYNQWLACLLADDRSRMPLGVGYRNLNMLFHWIGLPHSQEIFCCSQLASALVLGGLAWYGKKVAWPEHFRLRLTFDLACCWMVLLGPATESSTYILLAPSLAFTLADSLTHDGWRKTFLIISCGFLCLSVLGTAFGFSRFGTAMLQVLGAIVLCSTLLGSLLERMVDLNIRARSVSDGFLG